MVYHLDFWTSRSYHVVQHVITNTQHPYLIIAWLIRKSGAIRNQEQYIALNLFTANYNKSSMNSKT